MEKEVDYLKFFDELFKTKTKKNIKLDMPMLTSIFGSLKEKLYKINENHNRLIKKSVKIYDDLNSSITDEQRKKLKEYSDLRNAMGMETEKQLFLFGFIIAKQLSNETEENKI